MVVFRLTKAKYANSLSGVGSALSGRRWNSKGTEVIYTSSLRPLALLEVKVHLPKNLVQNEYQMVSIFIPDDISILKPPHLELPQNWDVFPYTRETQKLGDQFINSKKYCVFQTPSALSKEDYNFLINPRHPEFGKIKIIEVKNFQINSRI